MQTKETVWSEEQHKIFHWFATSEIRHNGAPVGDSFVQHVVKSKHLIVEAFAGTGKTTTMVQGVRVAPERSILMCAFNKPIADELSIRMRGTSVQAKTLHSVGFACARNYRERLVVQRDDDPISRADKLSLAVCGGNAPDVILRLVSKLHTKGREIAPHARQFDDLIDICLNFELEPDDQWENQGFGTAYVVNKSLEAMELASQVKSGETIDFSDMIFLPVRNRWMSKMYDLVVVDEAQDMTVAQLEIALGVCRGRVCVVGDPNQAIYAFRGADSNSLARLKQELKAEQLRLTTTYRCGREIVKVAQSYVPTFVAHESNGDGQVMEIDYKDLTACAAPGDFVVSRLNAPLVSTAMSLLRAGKRARVKGKDIGRSLLGIVGKLSKGSPSMEMFLVRLTKWEDSQVARFEAAKKDAKVAMIKDEAACLRELCEDSDSVAKLRERIEFLFTDTGLGTQDVITCSSVHKVKGLEAKRVFVLRSTLRDWDQEEKNIAYVAITRAIEQLVWVD